MLGALDAWSPDDSIYELPWLPKDLAAGITLGEVAWVWGPF